MIMYFYRFIKLWVYSLKHSWKFKYFNQPFTLLINLYYLPHFRVWYKMSKPTTHASTSIYCYFYPSWEKIWRGPSKLLGNLQEVRHLENNWQRKLQERVLQCMEVLKHHTDIDQAPSHYEKFVVTKSQQTSSLEKLHFNDWSERLRRTSRLT